MARSRKCKQSPKKAGRSLRGTGKSRTQRTAKKSRQSKTNEEGVSAKDTGDVQCSICLDTSRYRKMKALLCKHKFHEKCINMSLANNPYCPLCRFPCGTDANKTCADVSDSEEQPVEHFTSALMHHILFLTFQI